MKKDLKIEQVKLSDIVPDELQPRKNFNPLRLAELGKSIKRHGIMNPLLVEKMGTKFLLVDGERRFRASHEIGLKEVPVIIVDQNDPTSRLIQQFHIQEQHEGWSALEKAIAVAQLSKDMGINIAQLGEILSLPPRTLSDYIAFSKIIERKEWVKNEVPLKFAAAIINLRTFTKRKYQQGLNKEFTKEMEAGLEKAIIGRIKEGNITKAGDLVKIHDSIKIDPESIEKFISDSKITVDKLFRDTNARVAWYMRNIVNGCTVVASSIKHGMPLGLAKTFEDEDAAKNQIKSAYNKLEELINKF